MPDEPVSLRHAPEQRELFLQLTEKDKGNFNALFNTMKELGESISSLTGRFDALISSMQLGRPPRGGNGPAGGHGGPRKPRHLH